MEYIVAERDDRNAKMIKALRNIGIDISIEDLEENAGGKIITRAHYANVMVVKGYVKTNSEAFDKYIGAGRRGYVKRETLTPKNCIEVIKKSGGIPVLAHATLYGFSYLEVHNVVGELKKYGLMAMETIYSTYTNKQSEEMRKICEYYGLLKSGGSDFHGGNKPDISIGKGRGNLAVPQEFADSMKKYLM
ncbi:5'-3' exoribonuclease [Clostridiales bacterium]|nr:5'-3' exoribonuclease [Clostridiales bacterium]